MVAGAMRSGARSGESTNVFQSYDDGRGVELELDRGRVFDGWTHSWSRRSLRLANGGLDYVRLGKLARSSLTRPWPRLFFALPLPRTLLAPPLSHVRLLLVRAIRPPSSPPIARTPAHKQATRMVYKPVRSRAARAASREMRPARTKPLRSMLQRAQRRRRAYAHRP